MKPAYWRILRSACISYIHGDTLLIDFINIPTNNCHLLFVLKNAKTLTLHVKISRHWSIMFCFQHVSDWWKQNVQYSDLGVKNYFSSGSVLKSSDCIFAIVCILKHFVTKNTVNLELFFMAILAISDLCGNENWFKEISTKLNKNFEHGWVSWWYLLVCRCTEYCLPLE